MFETSSRGRIDSVQQNKPGLRKVNVPIYRAVMDSSQRLRVSLGGLPSLA